MKFNKIKKTIFKLKKSLKHGLNIEDYFILLLCIIIGFVIVIVLNSAENISKKSPIDSILTQQEIKELKQHLEDYRSR